MATTKLQLPTITGNMTNNVPRDLNALAEAIDAKAGTAGGLARLNAAGKPIDSLGNEVKGETTADKITITDPGNFYTSNNTNGALQEIGQALNGANGSIIDAVNTLAQM